MLCLMWCLMIPRAAIEKAGQPAEEAAATLVRSLDAQVPVGIHRDLDGAAIADGLRRLRAIPVVDQIGDERIVFWPVLNRDQQPAGIPADDLKEQLAMLHVGESVRRGRVSRGYVGSSRCSAMGAVRLRCLVGFVWKST